MSMWKLSAGTACVIGLKRLKTDALPTTAYIMLGEKCGNNCGFCAQARESAARVDLLARVAWPSFPARVSVAGIAAAHARGELKRACLQVVGSGGFWEHTVEALDLLRANSAVPVCVSSPIERAEQARALISRGAERICVALDAATPEIYREVKGGEWARRYRLLSECARALPGRVTTHLVVGLGENEKEMVRLMASCIDQDVTVGLFAFTPVRGTALAGQAPPPAGQYRRIQIAHSLLKRGCRPEDFVYCRGRLTGFGLSPAALQRLLADGSAFQTSGCAGCNRPYYNERPGGLMYNYPRPLTPEEIRRAVAESEIAEGGSHELAGCNERGGRGRR